MANYTLQSHGGAGLYMTADGTPTARRNVYIKARVSASLDQTWRIDSPSNGARTRIFSCKSNNTGGYALNNATATNNCDIISHIDNYKDSLVEFERYGTNVYYIKCITNGRYLTADGTAANSNVSWQIKASSEAQRWKLSVVSEGVGPFSVSSFSDGLTNNVTHTSSNSNIAVYKLSSTQKLRLAITLAGNYAISSSNLVPPGKTVSAKTNCAFFSSQSTASFNGLFKSGSSLYLNSSTATIPESQTNITAFINDGTHYPCFCVPSSGAPTIKWFSNYTNFVNTYQNYVYIFSGGHALVYNGKNIYDSEVVNDQSYPIACPKIYSPVISHTGGYADIAWDEPTTKRQRTLLGYAGARYYLIVSSSMTIFAAAQLAKELGCSWAMSFDGGGSTCMRVGTTNIISSSRLFSTALCACTN